MLGTFFAAGSARAQSLPLPFPLWPPPSFDTGPEPSPTETPSSGEPSRAHADVTMTELFQANSDAEREALRRSRRHESWYGWEVLTVDAVAVGILVIGAAIVTTQPPSLTASPAPLPVDFMAASLGVYALGPPIVHLSRGNFWQACASIGLRVALPVSLRRVVQWHGHCVMRISTLPAFGWLGSGV
jgi:hypothetical protein